MRRRRKPAVVVAALAAGLAAATALYLSGRLIPAGWAASAYPVHGIDVSHYQGAIDWPAVASDHVEFAYMKATEGADLDEGSFRYNWREAARSHISRGAYHFFRLDRGGAAQAAHFIATVPVDPDALPPAVDLEFPPSGGRVPSAATFRTELTAFLARLRRAYRREPIVYTTPDFYVRYLADYPIPRLWIRNTISEPRSDASTSWRFWQFADRGRVRGIGTAVDLDAFRGDRESLAALIGEPPTAPQRPRLSVK